MPGFSQAAAPARAARRPRPPAGARAPPGRRGSCQTAQTAPAAAPASVPAPPAGWRGRPGHGPVARKHRRREASPDARELAVARDWAATGPGKPAGRQVTPTAAGCQARKAARPATGAPSRQAHTLARGPARCPIGLSGGFPGTGASRHPAGPARVHPRVPGRTARQAKARRFADGVWISGRQARHLGHQASAVKRFCPRTDCGPFDAIDAGATDFFQRVRFLWSVKQSPPRSTRNLCLQVNAMADGNASGQNLRAPYQNFAQC